MPAERVIEGIGRAYLAFAAEHPRRYRLLFDRRDLERDDRPRAGVRRDSFGVLADALQACVDAGRSTSIDVLGDATSMWTSLHGFATLRAGVTQFPWPAETEFFRWFSEQAAHITGSYGLTADGATRMLVSRRPVGPCLLITPWNFPLAIGARKIGPAIAAGCTMVFKPAPQTPLTSLALAQLLADAGLPAGVLNVVPTTRAELITVPMMASGSLRKLSFTGSTDVGRLLLRYAATTVMRTSMELMGKRPVHRVGRRRPGRGSGGGARREDVEHG